jgi:hypothetical protein
VVRAEVAGSTAEWPNVKLIPPSRISFVSAYADARLEVETRSRNCASSHWRESPARLEIPPGTSRVAAFPDARADATRSWRARGRVTRSALEAAWGGVSMNRIRSRSKLTK